VDVRKEKEGQEPECSVKAAAVRILQLIKALSSSLTGEERLRPRGEGGRKYKEHHEEG